jgi:hypothetical protein
MITFNKEQIQFVMENRELLRKMLVTGKHNKGLTANGKYYNKQDVENLYLKCRKVFNGELMSYSVYKCSSRMHLEEIGKKILLTI